MITDNLLLRTDSYKASHFLQYPPGTTRVYSYIESRGGRWDESLFFGLQMFLKAYLSTPITAAMIDEAEAVWAAHGEPFHRAGWEHILHVHGGRLPLAIKAVPEGLIIPTQNILCSVENTDPACFWLTSFMETALLRAVWYPVTVATASWQCKQIIARALAETSDDPGQIAFKLHDFGGRGVSSAESAGLGGAAHLVNFMGTDTIEGVLAARRFYHEPMAGFSIPAAEHATITAWGREHEVDAYRAMLSTFGQPGKLVAVVSDSYDIFHAVRALWGGDLRRQVIDSGATVVIRPDSGDPAVVPAAVIDSLCDAFGFSVNSKGYKVLPPCVRVIQGDGITADSLPGILASLKARGLAADNLAFGMGGGLLQQVNRDTLKFAMKCSAVEVNGAWRDVFKQPVHAPDKASKRGRLGLVRENGAYRTLPEAEASGRDVLVPVWCDGVLLKDWTFAEVRANASQ